MEEERNSQHTFSQDGSEDNSQKLAKKSSKGDRGESQTMLIKMFQESHKAIQKHKSMQYLQHQNVSAEKQLKMQKTNS